MMHCARRMACGAALVAALIAVTGRAFAAPDQEVVWLTHDPVNRARQGTAIPLEASMQGEMDEASVVEAVIRFRTLGTGAWDYEDMHVTIDRLAGEIPAGAVTSEGVEYYLEVTLKDGTTITFPRTNAQQAPIQVSVAAGDEEAQIESGVLVISPEPDRVYREPSLLITASFNPSVHEVNPEAVVLRLDGRDVTRRATVTAEIISAVIESVDEGRHRIDLLERIDGRERLLRTWHFEYKSPFEEGGESWTAGIMGSVGMDGRTQRYSGVEQNVMRETVNLRFDRGDFRSQVYARLTSEEDASLQPQHRYRITAGWPSLRFAFGDLAPRYSDLILYGTRVRGAELRAKLGPVRVLGMYGRLKRGIDGRGYTAVDSMLVPEDPDSTYVADKYSYDPGTFARELAALRLEIGSQRSLQFGLTAMKARDDTASVENERPDSLLVSLEQGYPVKVDYTRSPRDNLVLGSDLTLNLDRRRITFEAEGAVSLYNSNIAERPLDDAEALKDVIWVNQYFEPLPEQGLPEGDEELDQGAIVNSILRNAFSWQTKLRLRYFGHDLRTGYKLINRSYNTLGNPALINDDAGFYIYDRVRVLDSRLYLNAGYRDFNNNVRGKSERTLSRNELSFGFSFYTGAGWPDLSFSVRQQLNENNGELTVDTLSVTDDSVHTATFDDRISNNTGSYNFGVTHALDIGGTRSNVNISYLVSDRTDEFQQFGDSRFGQLGLNASTNYGDVAPVGTRLSLSYSSQEAMQGLTEIEYLVGMFRLSYFFADRAFVPYAYQKVTIGKGDYALSLAEPPDDTDWSTVKRKQNIDFSRFDWVGGFEWRLFDRHFINARASFTAYYERGSIEYWDESTELLTSEDANRDDYLVAFTYTYKF
ncbi:MAG: hypothetical protein MAG453_01506 [Calditrichaeota bacterium]|nr:hypothetical protein [Calditrichota bacterium]